MRAVLFFHKFSDSDLPFLVDCKFSFRGSSSMRLVDFARIAEKQLDSVWTDTFDVFFLPGRSMRTPVFARIESSRLRFLTDIPEEIDEYYVRRSFDIWERFLNHFDAKRYESMMENFEWKSQ